jgi:predicted nucleic acid-binding protein
MMMRIFADALYWIAITSRKDQWHQSAMQASAKLAGCHLITTEEVFTEVLNAFCEGGPILRRKAAAMVRDLYTDPTVTIHPQTQQSFLAGLALYEARQDKEYSLTDCISMVAMRQEGITQVLTNDDHFTREGFTKLL